jgi:hypothetical protein
MLSSRAHEQDWWLEIFIDAFFFWEKEPHCKSSYEWEQGLTEQLHEPNEACKEIQRYSFMIWLWIVFFSLVGLALWLLFVIINY